MVASASSKENVDDLIGDSNNRFLSDKNKNDFPVLENMQTVLDKRFLKNKGGLNSDLNCGDKNLRNWSETKSSKKRT